jgi:hypothetical protein
MDIVFVDEHQISGGYGISAIFNKIIPSSREQVVYLVRAVIVIISLERRGTHDLVQVKVALIVAEIDGNRILR